MQSKKTKLTRQRICNQYTFVCSMIKQKVCTILQRTYWFKLHFVVLESQLSLDKDVYTLRDLVLTAALAWCSQQFAQENNVSATTRISLLKGTR